MPYPISASRPHVVLDINLNLDAGIVNSPFLMASPYATFISEYGISLHVSECDKCAVIAARIDTADFVAASLAPG